MITFFVSFLLEAFLADDLVRFCKQAVQHAQRLLVQATHDAVRRNAALAYRSSILIAVIIVLLLGLARLACRLLGAAGGGARARLARSGGFL